MSKILGFLRPNKKRMGTWVDSLASAWTQGFVKISGVFFQRRQMEWTSPQYYTIVPLTPKGRSFPNSHALTD